MKRLIAITVLTAMLMMPKMVSAETVVTCRNIYGSGEVCGETTVNEQKAVIVETGAGDNQMFKLLLGVAVSALVATGLYKLTYKSYILG